MAITFGVSRIYERQEHLRVPRKHVERIVGNDREERKPSARRWVTKPDARWTPVDGIE